MKAWESKNAKNAARAGGVSLMAVSLAACGGGSSESSDTDLTGTGETSTHVITRTEGDVSVLWSGEFANTTFGTIDISDLFSDNAITAGFVPPILTTEVANDGVVFGRKTSADDDQIYADGFAMHKAVIDGGLGDDTINIDMKAPFAQPLAVVNVENMVISNVTNVYADDDARIAALEEVDNAYIADSVNSQVDLFNVIGLDSLTLSEGSNAAGDLTVWNVSSGTSLTFAGNFANTVNVDYYQSMSALDVTLDNVSVELNEQLVVSQNAATINLTSTGGGVNDLDGLDFGGQLRTLNISGDTEINAGQNSALVFDRDRTAEIDASALKADSMLNIDAHPDIKYTGTDQATGIDNLTVRGAADSGETRLSLEADFGAGSAAVNNLTIDATSGDNTASVTTILNSDTSVTADSGAGVTLTIDGEGGNTAANADSVDATMADLSGVGAVVFGTNDKLELTAAQVGEIGIANFSTKDNVNDDGQLVISGVTSTTDLDLSGMDNGNLVAVRTADAADVTLSSSTVLGNLQSGVGEVQIMAESGDASLTMTADQFEQIADDEIVVVGIDGEGNPGNNPADNTPFEGTLTLTDVAADETLVLNNVTVDGVTVQVGAAGTTFTATDAFSITDTGGEEVTLEVSGTVDLTEATLTGVDAIVLMSGATVTATVAQLDTFDISGSGTINVSDDNANLTVATATNTYDLEDVNIVFAGEGTSEVTVSGTTSVTIESVSTTADVTQLTIDNDLTAGSLTITGASPAISLHSDTTTLAITAETGATVFGTESDDASTADVIEGAVQGSGLTAINVTAAGTSTVDLGVIGTVSDTLAVDANASAGTATVSAQIDVMPATADWTITEVSLKVDTGADIGTGSSLNLGAGTTLSGTADKAALPISADSVVSLTSADTAAEITTLLGALSGPTAVVDATGMTAAQLNSVAGAIEKVEAAKITGDVALTSDVSAVDMGLLAGKYDAGNDVPVVTAVATGMTAAQLDAVGGMAAVASDGITGTVAITSDNAQIGAILADTIRSATVTIDAGVTDDSSALGGTALRDIAGLISTVDTLTNVTYVAAADDTAGNGGLGVADDGLEARALLSATTGAKVVGTSLSTAEKVAIVDNIASVAADGITSLTLVDTDAAGTITTLLTKSVDATIDAGDSGDNGNDAMSIAQLSAIAADVSNVADINNLTITKDQTAAEITSLLSVVAGNDATVTLTGMSAAQITAVEGSIAKVGTLGGETTAAVLTQLDTADSQVLDASGVTKITGSLTEAQAIEDAGNGSSVNTLSVATDVAYDVTDTGTVAIADLAALHDETTGAVTVTGSATITGALSDLNTELVGGGTPLVTISDSAISITDAADAAALAAATLKALGAVTTGTVTVTNNTAISGSEVDLTAALVTAGSKVVTTSSNVTITGVDAIATESEQQVIEDIDAATSGTVDVRLTTTGSANFTGYQGGGLTITGNTGVNTITGTANADIITGGAGADVIDAGAGNDTVVAEDTDVNLNGGEGVDTISVATDSNFAGDTFSGFEKAVITVDDKDITVDLADAANFTAVTGVNGGNAELFKVVGTTGDDTIDLSGITYTDAGVSIDLDSGVDTVTVGTAATAIQLGGSDTDIDTVVFSSTSGVATITEFETGAAGDVLKGLGAFSTNTADFNTETGAAALDFGTDGITVVRADSSDVGDAMTAAEVETAAVSGFDNIGAGETHVVVLTADTDAASASYVYQMTSTSGTDIDSVTLIASLGSIELDELGATSFDGFS